MQLCQRQDKNNIVRVRFVNSSTSRQLSYENTNDNSLVSTIVQSALLHLQLDKNYKHLTPMPTAVLTSIIVTIFDPRCSATIANT